MADVAKLLETLHPMREPPPPAPILPALVMTVLGCLAALAVCALLWQAHRRGARLRRAAEAALAASRGLAPAERIAAQAQMLRRLVRGLDGDAATARDHAWLEHLDRLFATRFFTEGEGVAYGEGLYRRAPKADAEALDRSLVGLLAKVKA